ncbi:MAG: hypothetical protein K2Q07_09240 [Burkholderiaceae bacterium]|nr:hypothetical protein [Burkholderiaceae bacterium]
MNPHGNKKHGGSHSLTYRRWKSMRQRCLDPNSTSYAQYGGAGVTICARWVESFAAFLADMGECPDASMTLDRRDGSRGYEPDNCRWATRLEQNRNRATNTPITYQGRTMLVAEWAAELGFDANMLRQRLYLGWSVEKALSTPKAKLGRQR